MAHTNQIIIDIKTLQGHFHSVPVMVTILFILLLLLYYSVELVYIDFISLLST